MRVLLSFAPFIAFALLAQASSLMAACLVAACIGFAMLLRDSLLRGRSIKILEAGSVLLYAGLALATALHAGWSMWAVWVINDAALLLIALASLAIGVPFTIQYARERVSPDLWDHPIFLAVNARITAAWACAFAVMLASKLAVVVLPGTPGWAGIAASSLASIAALRFTNWYPAHVHQTRMAAQAAPAGWIAPSGN